MDKINWKECKKVSVVIDAANLESAAKDLGWWVDYQKLYQFFKKNTHLVGINHYCARFPDKQQDKFFTVLKKIGYKLVTKPLKIIKQNDIKKGDIRKANFDVEIAVDVLERMNSFNCLVLFSGDSDFDYLIKVLKRKFKKIIVFSTKYHISKELIETAHYYIDIKKIKSYIKRADKK